MGPGRPTHVAFAAAMRPWLRAEILEAIAIFHREPKLVERIQAEDGVG